MTSYIESLASQAEREIGRCWVSQFKFEFHPFHDVGIETQVAEELSTLETVKSNNTRMDNKIPELTFQ